jgi:hypothetical protein
LKKLTITVLALMLFVVLIVLFSPLISSTSNNPCNACLHVGEGYYQYFSVTGNQIPQALAGNETKTVTVTIQNDVNAPRYQTLTSASVTLSSAFGHFTVNSPTANIGELPAGATTVSWQITGTSDGYDYFIIQASARNSHEGIPVTDSIAPSLIAVGQPTGSIPTPPPAPTPAPTAPSIPITPNPTTKPTSTPTPTPTTPNQSPPPGTNQTQQLTIQLTSPSNNEKWARASNHVIEWQANGGTNPLNVTLQYTSTNGGDPWLIIATNLPSNGSYAWTTPGTVGNYIIQVTASDSANPPQSASATNQFEIQSIIELPVNLILAVVLVAVVLVVVFVVLRMRARRARK